MSAAKRPPASGSRARVRLGLRVLRDWRPTVAWVKSLLRSFATSFVVLAATLWLLPGITSGGLVSMLWLVVLVAAVGAVLRPAMLAVATIAGGYVALLIGICLQATVIYVALLLDPNAQISHFSLAFVAAWVAAALSAIVHWIADAGTDDAFLAETLRRMTRSRQPAGQARPPGLLIIQLDGVAAPLLQWAVRAGNLPQIGHWLRSGRYRLRQWHTGLPATTPAAQAGLLHGVADQIPAFRWYEKDVRRLVVTSRPGDAALAERRLSTGDGLLRHDGVSISNIFTGDAPTSLLTVSQAALPTRSSAYAAFMTSPYGLARGLVLGVGELLKELHQARLQRRRRVWPRVARGGAFLLLRPVTNVLLRDLNVSLVAEQMARGAPTIFCDFVDYDEVAHHAGPARHEAMAALEGLDRVVGILSRLAAHGGARDYRIVVLSDHGQSQGAPFRQRYQESIEQVVSRLLRSEAVEETAGATADVEGWGPVNTLLTSVTSHGGAAAAATRAATRTRSADGEVALGPAERERRAIADADADAVVVASGNLAMIYLTGLPGQVTCQRMGQEHPGLVRGLAAHPGIGVVVIATEADGPIAVGGDGAHRLRDGEVRGRDPLAPYGPRARADLLAHQACAHVGDLVLISAVDPDTEEVAAFEELVGCHGGLGGWQTAGLLLHPAQWSDPAGDAELVGPVAVHRLLARWRDDLGLGPHGETGGGSGGGDSEGSGADEVSGGLPQSAERVPETPR
ncbi:alkaline phosphatase family protein [Pilimelia columellifera]|uniref:Phage holin family protein n=1 Tax=Pilimelia columellifera subsp. columellifera TaxID=706583 RepID=A0ABP6ASP0_9ACTN